MTQDLELSAALRRDFALHREFLWGLCYRMTGSAADAEDLVQDTFERALRSPPPDAASSLRPWLSRVAINLSCDHLRRRKLQPYRGTWLPEPVHSERLQPREAEPADARYQQLESSSFAFLLALEALRPKERAVLLLRDVFDYSVRETAQALELSEANVKVLLHRARQRMLGYDQRRCQPSPDLSARTERAIRRFVLHMAADNVRGIEALLREDVLELSDPGEFAAARKSILGREKVALFARKMARLVDSSRKPGRMHITSLNGLPALLCELEPPRTDFSPRQAYLLDVDEHGQIARIYVVLGSQKLARLDFSELRGLPRWLDAGLRRLRFLARYLQRADKRLSRHIQVHPGSRVRPR